MAIKKTYTPYPFLRDTFGQLKPTREALPSLLILLASSVFFLLKFDLNVLDVTHSNWVYNLSFDPRTEMISWNYFRHTPWSFPIIGRLEGYDYPTVTGSAMTGIVSPLAIPFKLFSNWLPNECQYFGWWFLLCYLLQGYFGLKLLNNLHQTQNASLSSNVYQSAYVIRVLAAIFFLLSPPYLMRTGHMHMFSHFFILAALAQYFDNNRTPFQKLVYFIALSSLCVGVSQYTTVMVMGVSLASFVDSAYRRLMPFYRIFTDGLGVLLATVFVYYILGGFLMPFTTSQSVGFGSYASNLNTFFNPLEHSKIYAALPLSDADQYEGFGYLGVGFLALILSSVVYAIGSKIYTLMTRSTIQNTATQSLNPSISQSPNTPIAQYPNSPTTNFPILLMTLLFFIYALSCKIGWNGKLIHEWHYGSISATLFESLRASGRFIWVPVYVIMAYTLAYFLKMRLSNGVKAGVLAVFLGVQVYDIQKLLTFDKGMFERCTAENCTHHAWKPMLSEASRLVTFPLYAWNIKSDNDFFFFSRLASEVGKGITTGYFARRNMPLTVEYEKKAYADWANGHLGENDKAVFIGDKLKMWRFKKLVEAGQLLPFEYEGYGVLVPSSLKKTVNFMKNLPKCRPAPFYTEGVAEVFKRHEKNTIFVTACEEASYQLDDTTRAAFKQTGAKNFDKMGFREAYMSVIYKGKTVFEAVDKEKKLEKTFKFEDLARLFNQPMLKGTTVTLVSGGGYMGKDSKTIINGKEHSPCKRGLNFVVVDDKCNVVEILNFDTYAENYHAIFK